MRFKRGKNNISLGNSGIELSYSFANIHTDAKPHSVMRCLQTALRMKNGQIKILLLLVSILQFSCSKTQNDSIAYIIEQGGKTYIKLTGKRKLMAHDLISLLKGEKYKDSILLEVSAIKDGTVEGKNIPARKGYYKYLGNLTIKDHQLKVNLLVDNTDDSKQEALSWNGEYKLMMSIH